MRNYESLIDALKDLKARGYTQYFEMEYFAIYCGLGEAYARKLDEAGVPVTLTRYGGLIHDYGLLNPIANVPAAQMALLQAAAFIRKGLAD